MIKLYGPYCFPLYCNSAGLQGYNIKTLVLNLRNCSSGNNYTNGNRIFNALCISKCLDYNSFGYNHIKLFVAIV